MFDFKYIFTISTVFYLLNVNFLQVEAVECSAHEEIVTEIEDGWIRGTIRKADGGVNYYSFRGIRYAKPPLASLRFAPLQPVEPWEGIYDAREEGPVCPQKQMYFGRLVKEAQGQSEDCIFINVHVPETAQLSNGTDCEKTKFLPIVFILPSGGFQSGSGNSDLYGPELLMRHDIIVVTVSIRIGVFGYLSLNTPEVPGNNGLRDCITALRWLQRNARDLGGDPDNITLMGFGTGAIMAHLLSISPAATGLFHKLFLSSGTAIDEYYSLEPAYSAKMANDLRNALSGSSNDTHEFYQQLVNMDLGILMSAFAEIQLEGIISFAPVIEERFDNVETVIDQDAILSIVEGRDSKYPIILLEANSGIQLLKPLPVIQALPCTLQEDHTAIISYALRYKLTADELHDRADKIYNRYINDNYDLNNIIDVLNKELIFYPNRKYVQMKAKLGGAPIYMGRYSYEADYSVIKEGVYLNASGAVHCEDLTFVFKSYLLGDHDSFPPFSRDDQMRDMMTTTVSNFVTCGNPTCTDDEYAIWPSVKLNSVQYVEISEPFQYDLKNFTSEELDCIEFFDEINTRLSVAVSNIHSN